MHKFSQILVKYRYIILAAMLVIAAVCAVLLPKVNIITDMTKFLPDNSSMKHGVDIMSEEFDGLSASNTIRVMSTNLSDNEKQELFAELSALENITSVEYDADSDDYNKDGHSLFVVNSDYDFGTPEMTALQETITDEICPKYDLVFDTNSQSTEGLPPMIMLFAMIILLIILFCMCESWVEPFLFFAAIGMAVLINNGTNALLSGVSSTTNSITSILQLVLSMDYSIILINRYRQELSLGKEKNTAMTDAIARAASSIMSSSLTTVVGLLALVFMSFKIGADMGIVLAKGVLISMLCIFTVLPSLILLFDKAIRKTAKKVIGIKMDAIAAFSTKFKYAFPCVLVVLFVGMTVFKGNTLITYVMPMSSEIEEVFPKDNQVVVLYETADEDKVSALAADIENQNGIESVSTYSTTLGKQFTAAELSAELKELSDSMTIEPWMADFIFYDYYGGEISELSLSEFIDFTRSFIGENPDLIGDMNDLSQLDILSAFADPNELAKQRSAADIAALFGIDETAAGQLFAMSGKETMSLAEFLQTASALSGAAASVSPEAMAGLEQIKLLTNPEELSKERSAAELSQILGIDETMLSQLLMSTGAETASIQTVLTILQNPQFAANLPAYAAAKLSMLSMFTDPDELMKQRSADEISAIFSIDKSLITAMGRETISIAELLQIMENMSDTPEISLDSDYLEFIQQIIIDTQSGKKYSPAEIADLFGGMSDALTEDTVKMLYEIYFSGQTEINDTMSLEQLFGHILAMTESYPDLFDEDTKASLSEAQTQLEDGKKQLVGKNYSIMMISTTLPEGSDEITEFLSQLDEKLGGNLSGEYYLIGNSPMQYEMSLSFSDEFNKISIITAAAIFLVILITFRSLSVPLILILVIQTAVYATMVIMGLVGNGMYYMALLVVQSILMGATVDYGILFTSYYRENRKKFEPSEALAKAYNGSIHTILTSGLIITIETFILGFAFGDPAVGQICHIIAIGCACAMVLIIFVLPGVIIAFDRFTKGRIKKSDNADSVN